MSYLAFAIAALIPTFLVSRLMLWILKTWDAGFRRYAVANGVSLIGCALLGGMGMADGGAFAGAQALAMYAVPQLLWLVFDVVRSKGSTKPTQPQITA